MSRHVAVLVPGTLCDERVFAPMLAGLDVEPFFASLLGHDRVETAARAILAEAPQRFVGVGFSLGGFVVLEMLRQEPDRFSAVVLLSGNAYPDDPVNAVVRRSEVAQARSIGMLEFIEANLARYVAADTASDHLVPGELCNMAIAIGHEEQARQAEMNIYRPDLRAAISRPAVPLLIVAGSEDAVCPRERYLDAARGGEIELIPGAGHFAPLEAPESVAAAISTWMTKAVHA